jgi:mono/diheme cytochrome c family protein
VRHALAGAGVLILAVCTAARAVEPPSHAAAAYARYCASCHGAGGKGDGPAAGALVPPPTDLTKSCLPRAALMRVIDGRRTIRAHGDAKMPVWGRVFEQELGGSGRQHRQALREVQALAEYVQHLCARR